MGEFADIANERWADGDWEEDQEDEGPFPSTKTCRYCGEGGFVWNITPAGWRLANSEGVHKCRFFQKKNPHQSR